MLGHRTLHRPCLICCYGCLPMLTEMRHMALASMLVGTCVGRNMVINVMYKGTLSRRLSDLGEAGAGGVHTRPRVALCKSQTTSHCHESSIGNPDSKH